MSHSHQPTGGLRAELVQLPAARARHRLAEYLESEIVRFLQWDDASGYDRQLGFAELGFDSLRAVDFKLLLEKQLDQPLRSTLLFDYATPDDLAEYLARDLLGIPGDEPAESIEEDSFAIPAVTRDEDLESLDAPALRALLGERTAALDSLHARLHEPIAVVGMACRFPGQARSLEEFWGVQIRGEDAISEVPETRWPIDRYYSADRSQVGKMATRSGGFLSEPIDEFDARHFNISPREAQQLDPQQRILLETAWQLLEDAALPPETLVGSATGVFIGLRESEYFDSQSGRVPEAAGAYYGTGNALSTAAGRISFFFGLRGPAIAMDTACSSSLVALHIAIQSIRRGDCRSAIVGGVNLIIDPLSMVGLSQAQMLAPDGRCKTFDASADGYVRAEGCGLVFLKPLSQAQADRDRIYSVVRGTAVNQDGAGSGLTVPNGPSQERVLRAALADGLLTPDDVDVIEAHGTGTSLGDPIEVGALDAVFQSGRERPLWVSSVKTNIGHLETGAGIAGLIKASLAIHHGQLPAHLHLKDPNPHIDWDHTIVRVPRQTIPWPDTGKPRVAGVSSFGFSGTNAHVVLAQAPAPREVPAAPAHELDILPLTAATPAALQQYVRRVRQWLEGLPEARLSDITAPAALGRAHLRHRRAVIARDRDDLLEQLVRLEDDPESGLIDEAGAQPPRTAWLFTGQGAQWLGMGRDLFEHEPIFRGELARCTEVLRPLLPESLLAVMFGERGDLLHETQYTQPALFAIEVALAAQWRHWGLEPRFVLGHSVGEYAAAHVAGVFDLEDGLRLIAARGRLMAERTTPGDMLAVLAAPERIGALLEPFSKEVAIAAINGPASVVVSGSKAAIARVAEALRSSQIEHQALTVSHAFHSPLMDPMLDEFAEVARSIRYRRPEIPFLSNLEPGPVDEAIATPDYWIRHVRQPVRFHEGMRSLDAEGCEVYLEIGPAPTLLGMARRFLARRELAWLPSLRPKQSAATTLTRSFSELFVRGAPIDWVNWHGGRARRGSLRLPSIPFQRERFWFDTALTSPVSAADRSTGHPLLGRELATLLERRAAHLFAAEWSERSPSWLTDHRVFENAIAPAAAYLETLRAAAARALPESTVALDQVAIQSALPLASVESSIQVAVTPEDDGSQRLELASLQQDEGDDEAAVWRTHAIAQAKTIDEPLIFAEDLESLAERCDRAADVESLYADHARLGLDYGPAFRVIDSAWSGENEALARLRLPTDQDPSAFGIHPALLDGCFQIIGLLEPESEVTLLPIGVEQFRLTGHPGREIWCHVARRSSTPGERGFRVDITLLDAHGEGLGRVLGLHLVPASRATLLGTEQKLEELLYSVTWIPSDGAPSDTPLGPCVVVGAPGDDLAAALVDALPDARRLTDASEMADTLADEAPAHVILTSGASSSSETVPARAERLCLETLTLAQSLTGSESTPRLWLLTRGSQPALPSDTVQDPAGSSLAGLAATIATEHPELQCTTVDLDASDPASDVTAILGELRANDRERRVAWRGVERQVARLVRHDEITTTRRLELPEGDGFQLRVQEYGSLERLDLVPFERRAPGAGEVEIAVHAAALNFKDVLHALGLLKEFAERDGIRRAADQPFGFECAGEVVAVGAGVTSHRVGDAVIASTPGCLASHRTVLASNVAPQPPTLDAPDAAAIQTVFLTAVYGLERLAQLRKGDRVLIHAAAGGVGQAAIQIARRAGAEIFATASSGKWDHLRAQGIEHVYNSRTLDFADAVLADTGGAGVDVVLNCLAGDFIGASVRVLASDGRFVEIGKIDIWDDERMDAERPDVDYFAFDLGETFQAEPGLLPELLGEVSVGFARGELQPLARETFDLRDARTAFGFLAQAKNIGKVVLTIPSRDADDPADAARIRSDRSYLVTGGLGALGQIVARTLVDEGARHLILAGRSAPGESARATIAALEESGATVETAALDIGDRGAVAKLLESIRRSDAPLAGIVHAAGLLDDGMLAQQSAERFRSVLRPKISGAWWLHDLTADDSLDLFVGFGSMVSLVGNAGQSAYAAGNAFLDGLAWHRMRQDRPALTIDWGPWADAGMAARLDERSRSRLAQIGLRPLDPERGATIFRQLVAGDDAQVAVLPVSWRKFLAQYRADGPPPFLEGFVRGDASGARARSAILDELAAAPAGERSGRLLRFLDQQLSQVLGFSSTGQIEARQSFSDLGIDSLLAVDLKNRLESTLDVSLPATLLFDQPNLESLARFLVQLLEDRFVAAQPVSSPAPSDTDSADDLESLDEDELARRLAAQLESMQDTESTEAS